MKPLKIYISSSNDVYHNLALEEYIITQSKEDILLFYINSEAVVIGKHQNPWKEVDLTETTEYNYYDRYNVVRRLSGGGTVYHDLGNINFSFIRNKETDFVNFREHIEPISRALYTLGIENRISDRNDIFIRDHKISGNAEHVNSKLKRILHHGTLLYDSNIGDLNGSIRPKIELAIETHAVSSVRSPVMNVREVKDQGDTLEFLDTLVAEITKVIDISGTERINPVSINAVIRLVKEKYTQWDWNFGHTPQFKFTDTKNNKIKVRKGLVIEHPDNQKIGLPFDTIKND